MRTLCYDMTNYWLLRMCAKKLVEFYRGKVYCNQEIHGIEKLTEDCMRLHLGRTTKRIRVWFSIEDIAGHRQRTFSHVEITDGKPFHFSKILERFS